MSFTNALAGLKGNIDGALGTISAQVTRGSVAVQRIKDDIYPGDQVEFIINNYDSEVNYSLSTALGVATLTTEVVGGHIRGKIQYTAPGAPGSETIQINERQIQFPVLERVVVKPTLLSIAEGAVEVATGPTLTTGAFASTPAGYDSHQSTDWEIATDAGFTAVVWQSADNGTDLETISLPDGTLGANTTYYARVRHTGAVLGDSQWSDTISFTTTAAVSMSERALLYLSNGVQGDQFGYAVAISSDGQYAVVGARWRDGTRTNDGRAFVYKKSGPSWSLQQELIPSSSDTNFEFGYAVDISAVGDRIAVASPLHSSGRGSVFFYARTGETWAQSGQATTNQSNARMGSALAMSADGRIVVMGGYSSNGNGGLLFVSRLNASGTHLGQVTLPTSNLYGGDFLGWSVDVSDDGGIIVAGAPRSTATASLGGSVHIYTRASETTWSKSAYFYPPDVNGGDQFGYSVAISGDGTLLAVGVPYDDNGGVSTSGGVYVYSKSGDSWPQQAYIGPDVRIANSEFGRAVSLSGDGTILAVGAPTDGTVFGNGGSTYLFARDGSTWTQAQHLYPSVSFVNGYFGHALDMSGDGTHLIVGAYYADGGGTDWGAAYLFN